MKIHYITSILICLLFVNCQKQINSAEEAKEIIHNTEWEHPYELNDIGLENVSTYTYFSSDNLCYTYANIGDYKTLSKSEGLKYDIHFEKGEHNLVQICVNGCNNPNTYYLENNDKLMFVQYGSEIRTELLIKVK